MGCNKMILHVCLLLFTKFGVCIFMKQPAYACHIVTPNETYANIWGDPRERNVNCRDEPPTKNNAPGPPLNFSMQTLPPANLGKPRLLLLQWKFPQDGTGMEVKSFMLRRTDCGRKLCVIFSILTKVTPYMVNEGIISCKRAVCQSVKALQAIQADLYSLPLSSSMAHASLTHNVVYAPNITVLESCNGDIDVSFEDYGYNKYRVTVENGWDPNATIANRTIDLNKNFTRHTFTNMTPGKYQVVVLPIGCVERCKRRPHLIEIGTITCASIRTIPASQSTSQKRRTTPGNALPGGIIAAICVSSVVLMAVVVLLVLLVCRRRSRSRRHRQVKNSPVYSNGLMSVGNFDKLSIPSTDTVTNLHQDSHPKEKLRRKKVLIISFWDNSPTIRYFADFLQSACLCEVFLSAYKDPQYLREPDKWLNNCLNDADKVIILNSKLAFDFWCGNWKKENATTIDFSDDVFSSAIVKIRGKITGNISNTAERERYMMVRFSDTPPEFVLSNEIPGNVYELPSKLIDFLCRLHGVQLKDSDASLNVIYQPKTIFEWRWLSSLSTKETQRHFEPGQINMPTMNEVTDGSSTVNTNFVSPPPTEAVSVPDGAFPLSEFSEILADGQFDSGFITMPIDDITDGSTVITDFISPPLTEAVSVPDDAFSNSEFSADIEAYKISLVNKDPDTSTAEGVIMKRKTFDHLPSLESYTSAESAALSQRSDASEDFIEPESEGRFRGTDAEIRAMNLESDWLKRSHALPM